MRLMEWAHTTINLSLLPSFPSALLPVCRALCSPPQAKDLLSLPVCPFLTDAGGEVLSVPPLSNGYVTRTTADTRGAILLECSSAVGEQPCRDMLLQLVREAILLVEGSHPPPDATVSERSVTHPHVPPTGMRLLVEPVEVACQWDHRHVLTTFPSNEELRSLPTWTDEHAGE